MGDIERRISQKLAKDKSVQQYIKKEEVPYVISLALPSFFEAHPHYLNGLFKIERILQLQNEVILYAMENGQFEQVICSKNSTYKNNLEFLKVVFGPDKTTKALKDKQKEAIEKIVIPFREMTLEKFKKLSEAEVLEVVSQFASTWATQKYSEGTLTMWQVISREPLLLIADW